jgi:uncharacterized protein YjbI with pentapeptide repeats
MTDNEVNAEAQEERERWTSPQRAKAALEILKALQQGEDWRAISREISEWYDEHDLRGIPFSGADLRGADLRRANLGFADLRNAILDDADLTNVEMYRTDCTRASFRGTILADASGGSSNFSHCSFVGAQMSGVRMAKANFTGAVLRGASLRNAKLMGANFQDADLSNADLEHSILIGIKTENTNLHNAHLTGTRGGEFAAPGDSSEDLGLSDEATEAIASLKDIKSRLPDLMRAARDELSDNDKQIADTSGCHDSQTSFGSLRTPYELLVEKAREGWEKTLSELPVGTKVTGEVIGVESFGVFIRIDQHPKALGLAEIAHMPKGMKLPPIGSRVSAKVAWHNESNYQVKLVLREWTEKPW